MIDIQESSPNNQEQNEFVNPYSDTPILELAGGFGTRMKGSGERKLDTRPKALVSPQGQETFIDIALNGLCEQGFKNNYVLITTGEGTQGERIEKYVKRGIGLKLEKRGVKTNFSREDAPLGTAGASFKAISEFGLTDDVVITPIDIAFPFEKLQLAIEAHKDNSSSITWIVTSNPGENTQNIGKILVDKDSGKIKYNFENQASVAQIKPEELNDSTEARTSVGVFVVSGEYFTSQYKKFTEERPEFANKPVDLYRDFTAWLLQKGETVDTYDIQESAPDLGTVDRIWQFKKTANR